MDINKRDFYYGALLSKLVEGKFAPAILEKELEDGRFYTITNDFGTYHMFMKYVSVGIQNRRNETRWQFNFTENEIDYLKEQTLKNPTIVLICGTKQLKNSRAAFLSYDDFKKAIGIEYKTSDRHITVKHLKHSKYFIVYGTALDGETQYIQLTANITKRIEEIKHSADYKELAMN